MQVYCTTCQDHSHLRVLDTRPSVFDESTVRDQSSDEEDITMFGQLECPWKHNVHLLIHYRRPEPIGPIFNQPRDVDWEACYDG